MPSHPGLSHPRESHFLTYRRSFFNTVECSNSSAEHNSRIIGPIVPFSGYMVKSEKLRFKKGLNVATYVYLVNKITKDDKDRSMLEMSILQIPKLLIACIRVRLPIISVGVG